MVDHHDNLSAHIHQVNTDDIATNDDPPLKGGTIDIIRASDGTLLKRFDTIPTSVKCRPLLSAPGPWMSSKTMIPP